MKELKMPSFGADMEQGRLTEWLVKPGDKIERGDVIAIVETNKGAIELDVFEAGVVHQLLIGVEESVDVGAPIATIDTGDSKPEAPSVKDNDQPASPPGTNSASNSKERAITAAQEKAAHYFSRDRSFVSATPAARKFVAEHKLNLQQIEGSGEQGAITLKDAEVALTRQQRPKGFDAEAMRKAISATVTLSKREIPHYYLSQTLDVTALQDYLVAYNEKMDPEKRLVLVAPLLCAIAKLLPKHSKLNGLYQNGSYSKAEHVQLANAVNLRGGGLVMPVIANAELHDAETMMATLNDLVLRAKTGNLRYSELNGATVTVTSIGDRGADAIFGVIYPPQVAIIGLGRSRSEAQLSNGQIVEKKVITATLAADHRVSDGHDGARFLHQLNKRLQSPEALWTKPI